jgi:hypothetical protein
MHNALRWRLLDRFMLPDEVIDESVTGGRERVIVPALGVCWRLAGATLAPMPHGQEEPFKVANR